MEFLNIRLFSIIIWVIHITNIRVKLMSFKTLAPAKINLGLEIGKKNIDGYHEVEMIMQSISLFDEIEISKSCDSKIDVISDKKISCPTEQNIAYRAALEFFEYTKIKNHGIRIKIKKNIPMCAGLAGGSADGAGVIVGLNKAFETNLNFSQMCEIGAKIGSDIPFCVIGGAAAARGIGTELTPINTMPDCAVLIIKPDFSISTANAYSRFDSLIIDKKHSMNLLEAALKSRDLLKICSNLYNRFEDIIDNEEIFNIKQKLDSFGAVGSLMTGSGSAVYGVFDDIKKAKICLQDLYGKYESVSLARPLNHGAIVI